jgi:hypothetical protein
MIEWRFAFTDEPRFRGGEPRGQSVERGRRAGIRSAPRPIVDNDVKPIMIDGIPGGVRDDSPTAERATVPSEPPALLSHRLLNESRRKPAPLLTSM